MRQIRRNFKFMENIARLLWERTTWNFKSTGAPPRDKFGARSLQERSKFICSVSYRRFRQRVYMEKSKNNFLTILNVGLREVSSLLNIIFQEIQILALRGSGNTPSRRCNSYSSKFELLIASGNWSAETSKQKLQISVQWFALMRTTKVKIFKIFFILSKISQHMAKINQRSTAAINVHKNHFI